MNTLDYILIVIFIVCLLNGYIKGFFKKLFDIVGFILGIVIFKFLYPIINNLILESNISLKIRDSIISNLNMESINFKTQEEIVASIQNLDLPNVMKDFFIENNYGVYHIEFGSNSLGYYIAGFIAIMIISFLTSVIVIIISVICINILSKTTNILSKLPILSTFDKIGGLIIGFFVGIIVILVLCFILYILSIFPQFYYLKSQFNGVLTKPLINDNILMKLLLNFILGVVS